MVEGECRLGRWSCDRERYISETRAQSSSVFSNKGGWAQRSREQAVLEADDCVVSAGVRMEDREARLCRSVRIGMSLLSLGNDATMVCKPKGRSLVENSKARVAGKRKQEGESVLMLPVSSALGDISVFMRRGVG